MYDCTNRVKNGSVGTKARFSEYLCFGRGSRDATILHSLPFSNTFFTLLPTKGDMLLIFVSHAKNLGDHVYVASALILVMISDAVNPDLFLVATLLGSG